MCTIPPPALSQVDRLHARFVELLPRIERHGRTVFRHLKCPATRADAIQEMLALAWKWFLRLTERGKNAAEFLAAFTRFLARAVRSGRRLIGMEKAKDVMCSQAQRRHGFKLESLSAPSVASYHDLYSAVHGQRQHDAFEERLRDNTVTPVPEQAAFRIDWSSWLCGRTERDRRLIDDLMAGERTLDIRRKHGVSPARVSQLRREYHEDWERFCSVPEVSGYQFAA